MNDGKATSSPYAQQNPSSGSLYSFSVHQPYTNWPLHASHTTPYAQSWYTAPTATAAAQYGTPKVYAEQGIQVPDLGEGSSGGGKDGVGGGGIGGVGKDGVKFAKQWEDVVCGFLKRVGMYQALAGFREDMLLLNEEWEREQVPSALRDLVKDISVCDVLHFVLMT